jgi:hypothetical protein
MDLLIIYTHHSELREIIAPLLISTIYKSPQLPLGLFPACCVLNSSSLATISNFQLPTDNWTGLLNFLQDYSSERNTANTPFYCWVRYLFTGSPLRNRSIHHNINNFTWGAPGGDDWMELMWIFKHCVRVWCEFSCSMGVQWWALLRIVMNLRVPWKARISESSTRLISALRINPFHGVSLLQFVFQQFKGTWPLRRISTHITIAHRFIVGVAPLLYFTTAGFDDDTTLQSLTH